jgi:hypothetical protein
METSNNGQFSQSVVFLPSCQNYLSTFVESASYWALGLDPIELLQTQMGGET